MRHSPTSYIQNIFVSSWYTVFRNIHLSFWTKKKHNNLKILDTCVPIWNPLKQYCIALFSTFMQQLHCKRNIWKQIRQHITNNYCKEQIIEWFFFIYFSPSQFLQQHLGWFIIVVCYQNQLFGQQQRNDNLTEHVRVLSWNYYFCWPDASFNPKGGCGAGLSFIKKFFELDPTPPRICTTFVLMYNFLSYLLLLPSCLTQLTIHFQFRWSWDFGTDHCNT